MNNDLRKLNILGSWEDKFWKPSYLLVIASQLAVVLNKIVFEAKKKKQFF